MAALSRVSRIRAITIAALAGAVLFAPALASAQLRGPFRSASPAPVEKVGTVDAETARAAQLAELESWLGGLKGRYDVDGGARVFSGLTVVGSGSPCPETYCYIWKDARGTGECIGIGEGPGVHCLINVPWPRFPFPSGWIPPTALGRPPPPEIPWSGHNLGPASILFGIDPDIPGIRLFLADGLSRATEAVGELKGETVRFRLPVPGDPSQYNGHTSFTLHVPRDRRKPLALSYEVRSRRESRLVLESYRFDLRREPPAEAGL